MSNFVLTLPLKTEKYQEHILERKFDSFRRVYNACLSECLKRYNHMRESKDHQKICKLPIGKERNKQFSELNKRYGLTEYSLHTYINPMRKQLNLDSNSCQKTASRAFATFEKLMFHKAKKVRFIKFGEMFSIEGKSNKQGIRFKDNKLIYGKLSIPVAIKDKDAYAKMAIEENIKYCRIVKKEIKRKIKWYIQLIIGGIPPMKITSQSEIKGKIGVGKVGIDIGTQTIGYASSFEVKLLELAPNVDKIEKELRLIQRKMDRSKHSMNPNKYNENGTIKKGNRDKWIFSNRYKKLKSEYKELFRKQSAIRKQDHNILSNHLINLGDEFYVEKMNFKGLQKRAKKTTKNKNGKFNKKKRFGKSLANKAPAMFLTILENKLKWNGAELNRIDTAKVKASQYNHLTNECVKKSLSKRWNEFEIDGNIVKVQRDLYSSFLIMNVKKNLKEIDRDLCFETFDGFLELHNIEIERIKNSESKLISSMGI